MKPERILVAGLFCLMLFASPAFASSGHVNHQQSLSLTLTGMISNPGSQGYELGGGKLVQGMLFNQPLTSGHVEFDLDANVRGLGATGSGSLEVSTSSSDGDGGQQGGQGNGHQDDGDHGDHSNGVGFSARISITGTIPAAIFPITVTSPTTYSSCDPSSQSCNGEIPLFFTGVATIDGHGSDAPAQIPIAIESPYWNPFGGPILITSLDSITTPSIFLVVSYDRASIDWDRVQLQGQLAGTYGTEAVTGSYGQVVNSQENLVLGKEFDTGTIAFVGMSDPTLNANGWFLGHTSFNLAGSFDCSSEFGLPEGTCTATGATSHGAFWMSGGQKIDITGTYYTVWSVPSLFTLTTVMAAVSQD